MSRPLLTPDTMEPGLRLFRWELEAETHIDVVEFADWIRNNLHWLRDGFSDSDEPHDTDAQVENCQGIWLRMQFKQQGTKVS